MSNEKKQNVNEEERISDEKKSDNLDVANLTPHSDDTTRISSEIADANMQHHVDESTEIMPNDVIIIEDVTSETLEGDGNKNICCKIFYEFPSDYEDEYVSHFDQAYTGSRLPDKIFEQSNNIKCFSDLKLNKNSDDKLAVEVFDTKSLNKETPSATNTAEISDEIEREREKFPISLMRHKKVENRCQQRTQSDCKNEYNEQAKSCSSSEFADIEDNVAESSSSGNDEPDLTNEIKQQTPLKDLTSDLIQNNKNIIKSFFKGNFFETNASSSAEFQIDYEDKIESFIEENYFEMNASSSTDSDNSEDNQAIEKDAIKAFVTSLLKDDTTSAVQLCNETKKKFEVPLATTPKVPEFKSDEPTHPTMLSKSNPLKMKTVVKNRKDRCNVCNVKLGLCAIRCRCGGYYCAKHRYDREHNCSFDYKSMGAAEIQKNNPKIEAEKIRKL